MVTQQHLDDIIRILVAECHPQKIILFGSYAHGTAKEDSDLDLAIVAQTDLSPYQRAVPLRKALRANGRRWPFGMDILIYTPEEIKAQKTYRYSMVSEILSTGKVIYES